MGHVLRSRLAVALMAMLPAGAVAETLRCGRWVVSAATPPAEILAKCGPPTSKTIEKSDVWAPRTEASTETHVVGQTVTEQWVYERGPTQFTMVFTIRDGRTVGLAPLKQ